MFFGAVYILTVFIPSQEFHAKICVQYFTVCLELGNLAKLRRSIIQPFWSCLQRNSFTELPFTVWL